MNLVPKARAEQIQNGLADFYPPVVQGAAARGYRALAIRKLTVPVPTRSMLSLASRKARQEIGIGAAGWRLDGGKDIFRVVEVFGGNAQRSGKPNGNWQEASRHDEPLR